jgi:hypothetical protein
MGAIDVIERMMDGRPWIAEVLTEGEEGLTPSLLGASL